MKIWLVEDEILAAERLNDMLLAMDASFDIEMGIETIKAFVKKWKESIPPDLIFLDIHLADGASFEIFDQVEITCPVVFATAYDQYAIKAFQVNGMDYLLKPIDNKELYRVFEKMTKYQQQSDPKLLRQLVQQMEKTSYKKRVLIKRGEQLQFLDIDNVSYFFYDTGIVFVIDNEGRKHALDGSLDALENTLNPQLFFRVNRQLILQVSAISKIQKWFNNRLKLELKHPFFEEVIVSRDRVKDFKIWMEG